jgi:hypothetical protein
MNKKLMVVPMKSQYEQHCNAAALKKLDVPILKKVKKKSIKKITRWIEEAKPLDISFPDVTAEAVKALMEKYEKVRS